MDNRSYNSKTMRNSCSCMNCDTQNCLACRQQEASICTCDRCENSKTCLYFKKNKFSQDKLTQIYDASQVQIDKHDKIESTPDYKINIITESKETLKNNPIRSLFDELNNDISGRHESKKLSRHNEITECLKTCPIIARPVKTEYNEDITGDKPDENTKPVYVCGKDTGICETCIPEKKQLDENKSEVVQSAHRVLSCGRPKDQQEHDKGDIQLKEDVSNKTLNKNTISIHSVQFTQENNLDVTNPEKDNKNDEINNAPAEQVEKLPEKVFIIEPEATHKENKNENVLICKPCHKEDKIARCKKCNKILNKSAKITGTEKAIAGVDKRKKRCDKQCLHSNHHKSNKILEFGTDQQGLRNKIYPAFCPACHKVFIEESNEERLPKKTMIILNECPECLEANPMAQRRSEFKIPLPIKCSELKEIKRYFQPNKNRDFQIIYEYTTTGVQTEDKKQEKSNDDWLTEQKENVLTWIKEFINNELSNTQPTTANKVHNANTKTKSVVSEDNKTPPLIKCSNFIDMTNCNRQKQNKICSKSSKSLITICCHSPSRIQDIKTLEKCRAECASTSICTQTEKKKVKTASGDNLTIDQKKYILDWIKECIHKELKDFRSFLPDITGNSDKNTKRVNNEEEEEKTSETIPMEKWQTSKQSDNQNNSYAVYDKIKGYIKDKLSGSNKTDGVGSMEAETSDEIQEIIVQTNKAIKLLNQKIPEAQKVKIHSCNIKRDAQQIKSDKNRGQRDLEFGKDFRNGRKTLEHKEREAVSGFKRPTFHSYKTLAGELSAEIMNVPYTKYKQSTHYPEIKPNYYTNENILKIINRIYKACSCKVCECVSNSPTTTEGEVCNCKPCGCVECSGQRQNCNSNFCSTKINNKKILQCADSDKCECKLCKCIECNEQSVKKSCNCKPCECIKCNNLKDKHMLRQTNFIVAPVTPVDERQQRPYCQCSPCGCFECAHPFGTLAPTHYSQETTTDERRHMNCNCQHCENDQCEEEGIDTCSCNRQSKLMRKPVTHDKNEYDIHYCLKKTPDFKNFEYYLNNKKRSPVTIYTSLTHCRYFPRTNTFIDSTYSSLSVDTNSDHFRSLSSRTISVSIRPQNYWALRANTHLIPNSINECDCKPCECNKCKKHFLEGHIPYRQGNCSCEICDCVNCATLNVFYEIEKKYNKREDLFETEQKCNCLPCSCKHCSNYSNMIIHNDYYNLNGGGTTVPSTEQRINNDNFLSLVKVLDSESFIDRVLLNKESRNHTKLTNKSFFPEQKTPLSNRDNEELHCANMQKNEYHVYCNKGISGVTNDADTRSMQYNHSLEQERNSKSSNGTHFGSKEIDETMNNSQISNHTEEIDSTISSSMTSLSCAHINDTVSKEPKKISFKRSSCNSSGYDYSDYLIRFPTSTVETCIKDVMSLPYNGADKDYLKLSPTSKPVKDYSESSISTLHYQKELSSPGLQSLDTLQLDDTDNTCKSGNSDKLCNCNPCDCDKCSYKMPKLERCHCNCASCRCDGTCLSEDRSVLIRKNETTQTAIPAPDCGEVITKELSSLKLKKSIVTFSDNDKVVKRTDYPVPKVTYNIQNHTINDYPTVKHDSVQRTIREAKQFSLELLGILQKYEKANRDFESMRQRYKTLHDSIPYENVDQDQFTEQPNNYQIAYIKTMPKFQNNTSTEKNRIKFEVGNLKSSRLSNLLIKEETANITPSEADGNILQEIDIQTDERNFSHDYNIKSSYKDASKPSFERNKYVDQDNILQGVKQTESASSNDQLKTKQINAKAIAKSVGKLYLEKLKSEYKEYSLHIDEVIKKRRQTEWKNDKFDLNDNRIKEYTTNKCSTTTSKWNGFSYQIPPVKEFINKENSGDLNTVFICQSQKYQEPYRSNEARRVFGSSTSTPRIASRRFELSPSGTKSATETNTIKTCNINYSLKVIFQSIRKVSEHSILLKWKIPDDTTNIEGYEIQVDGRSIQRILNPTRNMAVLTCLPHSDKVQITVRTITKMDDTPMPCATISICNRF